MCLAKINNSKNVKINNIDDALKNITGMSVGKIDYKFSYHELESYFLDNYLGVSTKKNLVSINYCGDDENLKLLLEEIKTGFGIFEESILELNLTNFTESFALSALIGTPPGYVGYEDGGILSEHYARFIYQVIVVKNIEKASPDIKFFIESLVKNGRFYDKKGREFKTNNSVFIFVDSSIKSQKIGFITNVIDNSKNEMFDLILGEKQHYEAINPYIDSFSFRGFDISFNEDDFNMRPNSYKKKFLELIKKYNKGKYFLSYNNLTEEIEIINK